MNNTIEAEVVPETSMAVAVRPSQPVGLFGASEPAAVIEKATSVANALKGVIVRQGLVSKISGKEYPRCEAWTLLGTMLGVFPVTVWTKEVEGGWEARVEARTKDGAIIGAAEAQCLRAEKNWANRDDFALRSMAQTRATAKCLRMPLGFVMTLAGFEATPAEEMVSDHPPKTDYRRPAPQSATSTRPAAQSSMAPQKPKPAPPQNKPAAPEKKFATAKTRDWLIKRLEPQRDLATEYFRKLANPTVLMPNENLEDLGLEFLPVDLKQTELLEDAIRDFGNGGEVRHAFRPNELKPVEKPKEPEKPKPAPAPAPPPAAAAPAPAPAKTAPANGNKRDPEWFFDMLVTVPPKGVKRDDYLKAPDTIRALYTRLKEGDEEAGRRLWGFVSHYEPKPWTGRDGQQRQPSNADLVFREALDAFKEWHDRHGKDKAEAEIQSEAEAEQQDFEQQQEEDDVPF